MTEITDETMGWTIAVYHESGGIIAEWFETYEEAVSTHKPKDKDYLIRIVRRSYKDRMNL